MTALALAAGRQLPTDSDFTALALFSVVGLVLSLALLVFGINPGDLG